MTGQKARALLAYLAANFGGAAARARLATLLWGDRPERQSRDSLKQAVWQLRRCLEAGGGGTALVSDRQTIALDPAAVTVDVADFHRLVKLGTPQAIDQAIDLYRGDLIDGLEVPDAGFEEWLLVERQRLRHQATEAMAAALARATAGREADRAAVVAQQLLRFDPHHEGACRTLMQIHADRAERTKALSFYESFKSRLARDLGIRPETATEALYDAIRCRRAPTVPARAAADAAVARPLPDTGTAGDSDAVPSVAVLRFVNIGGDPAHAYFAEGLTEDVITDLSQISGLRTVVHRTAPDSRERPTPEDAARTLRTSHVLEGSVRRIGDRVRITAQLLEAATANCIWARRFDRAVSDIFGLQEELSLGIAEALRVTLLPDELQSLAERPTESADAYQLFLLGRSFYLRGSDKRSLRIAHDLFSKAAEIDPLYAHAHAARATCETTLCGNDPSISCEGMLATSERAIELAPTLGDAHAAKGLACYVLGRYGDALDHFDRATSLAPSLFEAYFFKARCCRLLGQREPALALFAAAAELRPDDYRCAGLLAEEYRALGFEREFHVAATRALRHASHEVQCHPENADAWAFGSTLLAELGEDQRGEAWASRAVIIGSEDYLVHYNVSRTLALLGCAAGALDSLEHALQSLPVFRRRLLAWMPLDRALDSLRGHQRFARMVTAAATSVDERVMQ